MSSRRLFIAATSAAALLALSACATPPASQSVADRIASEPSLATLNDLVTKAGLRETLAAPGPYTVLAPTNAAFAAVPAKTMTELANDPAKLKAVLSYHVLPGNTPSAEIKTGNTKTLNGADVALSRAGSFVTAEDAVVEQPDLVAANGTVLVVDRVLMPPKR